MLSDKLSGKLENDIRVILDECDIADAPRLIRLLIEGQGIGHHTCPNCQKSGFCAESRCTMGETLCWVCDTWEVRKKLGGKWWDPEDDNVGEYNKP